MFDSHIFITLFDSHVSNTSSRYVSSFEHNRLVGLVVKGSAWRAGDPGFDSRLRQDFSGSSHTRDLKKIALHYIGYPARRLAL